ncbi:MAG: type III-B CRISPR module RAMP protein Cmr6 [Anaerolineae bacterium]|nr:type III-B CRISPR module RAMP protein Cmr6 [Anaerolineae bacterium]
MSNQALPQKSQQMLENHLDRCQNLGLILDKFAPWGQGERHNWDLIMRSTVRKKGENKIQTLSGGEAKGLWLNPNRRALNGESPSLFEVDRTDTALMQANYQRWQTMIRESDGLAFTMMTIERLVAGLGASHVLETALTLDRNTGLPYLPGSSVKGLARAWGLIEVAAQLGITLTDDDTDTQPLNQLAELLISESDDDLFKKLERFGPLSDDIQAYVQWFRYIFGSQSNAGAVCFMDAVYAGSKAPIYAADVMTPHYVNYYTANGGSPPAEDDNPNPVSFITVDRDNVFAFGLVPRRSAFENQPPENQKIALETAAGWLQRGLTDLGAGSKTAAGYGYFSRKSMKVIVSL